MRYSSTHTTGGGWLGKELKDRDGLIGTVTGDFYSEDLEWTILEVEFPGEEGVHKVHLGNRQSDKHDSRKLGWKFDEGEAVEWVPLATGPAND